MEDNKPINSPEEGMLPNNEQQLNNPSTGEPIVPAAETTSEVEQPQTKSYKPETEDMEVHHHTHPGHHKKKWTDYISGNF